MKFKVKSIVQEVCIMVVVAIICLFTFTESTSFSKSLVFKFLDWITIISIFLAVFCEAYVTLYALVNDLKKLFFRFFKRNKITPKTVSVQDRLVEEREKVQLKVDQTRKRGSLLSNSKDGIKKEKIVDEEKNGDFEDNVGRIEKEDDMEAKEGLNLGNLPGDKEDKLSRLIPIKINFLKDRGPADPKKEEEVVPQSPYLILSVQKGVQRSTSQPQNKLPETEEKDKEKENKLTKAPRAFSPSKAKEYMMKYGSLEIINIEQDIGGEAAKKPVIAIPEESVSNHKVEIEDRKNEETDLKPKISFGEMEQRPASSRYGVPVTRTIDSPMSARVVKKESMETRGLTPTKSRFNNLFFDKNNGKKVGQIIKKKR